MIDSIILPKRHKTGGSKKLRRSAKNKRSGKYLRQYKRTVARTGRWRGKRAS